MTTASIQDRVNELFADARDMQAQALDCFDRGDIRDAAEKAWCAVKRATDGLILIRTGEEPVTTAATTNGLDALARRDPDTRMLQGRYYSRIYNSARNVFLLGILQRPNRASHQGDGSLHRRRRSSGSPMNASSVW